MMEPERSDSGAAAPQGGGPTTMLQPRPFLPDDLWRARAFLRETFDLAGRRPRPWHVARLEYACRHGLPNVAGSSLEEVGLLWEQEGTLLGFVLRDGGPGEAHLCTDPRQRSDALERAMLLAAEEQHAVPTADGRRALAVWCFEDDGLRAEVLRERGYAPVEGAESQWRRDLRSPVHGSTPASGYALRAVGDGLELLERAYASGLAFHDGDVRVAFENRTDPSWYVSIQRAPLYRRDLDLVAVAPDGSIAAFATFWFDDVTRSALVEPCATVPEHRRRGLARSLLEEGLRRVRELGALDAFVGGYDEGANALYRSVFVDGVDRYEPWLRRW
jgi:mycothiol synthase